MADRELRIRIGAAIDASFTTVFASVMSTVKRARQTIEREMKAGAVTQATAAAEGGKAAIKAHEKTAKSEVDLAKKNAAQMALWEHQTTRTVEREARAREKVKRDSLHREMQEQARAAQRGMRDLARVPGGGTRNPTGSRGNGGTGGRSFLHGFGMSLAYRAGATALSFPGRAAGDILRGFGADTDIASLLQGGVQRQAIGQQIANSAYIPQGGPQGSNVRVSGGHIVAKAAETGIATGIDTQEVLEGIQKFVGLTGDLQTMEESMTNIGKIAKANGADFGDMASAAGEVANAMGDIPNKGKAITNVMRVIAGQGQLTAIEIRDMAKYIGMLTGQANFFKIDSQSAKNLQGAGVTSEAGQRVAVVSGLAQFARARGGRVTARQAMQSAMAMVRDMASPTEVKRMQERGLSPYADSAHSTLRDPVQMILESFKQAQGKGGLNRDVLNRLFPNQQSRAVVNAFAQTYNEEYKKQAEKGVTDETIRHSEALKEVNAEFQRMLRVTQSQDQVDKAFAKSMETAESQATVFKNQLGKVGDQLTVQLLPAFLALTPYLLGFAKMLASLIERFTGQRMLDPTVQLSGDRAAAVLENTKAKLDAKQPITHDDTQRYMQTIVDLNNARTKRQEELDEMRKTGGTGILRGRSEEQIRQFAAGAGGITDAEKREAQQYIEALDALKKMDTLAQDLTKTLAPMLSAELKNAMQSVVISTRSVDPPGADPKTSGTGHSDSASY